MNYNEYVDESKKDLLNPEEVDLDQAALQIPALLHKWSVYEVEESLKLRQLTRKQHKMYKILYTYYSGKMTEDELTKHGLEPFPYKLLKQDIDKWINADDVLNDIEDEITKQTQTVKFIEKKMKEVSNRQWNIKSAIDHRKFMSGG